MSIPSVKGETEGFALFYSCVSYLSLLFYLIISLLYDTVSCIYWCFRLARLGTDNFIILYFSMYFYDS